MMTDRTERRTDDDGQDRMENKERTGVTDRTERMQDKERTDDDGQDRENGEWRTKRELVITDRTERMENGEQGENW